MYTVGERSTPSSWDSIDQLMACAGKLGVSTATLLEGAEQVRAMALRHFGEEISIKTTIRMSDAQASMEDPSLITERDCRAVSYCLVKTAGDEGEGKPTLTLTVESRYSPMSDFYAFMVLLSRQLKLSPPIQPMLDLFRGTKGEPLHICLQSEESPLQAPRKSVLAEHLLAPDLKRRPVGTFAID